MLRRATPAVLLPVALALAACGSAPTPDRPTEARRGGTLTVLVADPAALTRTPDPHRVQTAGEAAVHGALFRRLYAWRPGEEGEEPELVPDLAEALPEVAEDGRTLTVRLRARVRFPSGRAVTARDVERGLERALGDPVAGPVARQALGALAGLAARPDGPRDVRGVEAVDDRTLVLRLRRPGAPLVTAALATALATPVPAGPPRRAGPLPEGSGAFTGPYVPAAPGGEEVAPGEVVLERNPRFAALDGDWRGAGADRLVLAPGAGPPAEREVLDGAGLVLGDGVVSDEVARRAARRPTEQTATVPLPVTRFVALSRRPPLDDVDVRRALGAALDRRGMAEAADGAGEVAGHWLPPAVPGHDESGGAEGPRNPWLAAPEGDLAVARAYLRRAAPAARRALRARPLVALVPDRADDRAVAEAARRSLAPLGVRLRLRAVPVGEAAAGCRGAAMTVDLCPSATLTSLVRDPEAVLRAGLDAWGPLGSDWAAGAVAAASGTAEGEERAWRWAEANRAVLQAVPGIPWRWDERRLLVSRDVRGVADVRRAAWDLAATALEAR